MENVSGQFGDLEAVCDAFKVADVSHQLFVAALLSIEDDNGRYISTTGRDALVVVDVVVDSREWAVGFSELFVMLREEFEILSA